MHFFLVKELPIMKSWQIQEVKQQLSEVIKLACDTGPQQITFRGDPKAWILSDQDYLKLINKQESIVDFFQRSPHRDIDLELKRRTDKPRKFK